MMPPLHKTMSLFSAIAVIILTTVSAMGQDLLAPMNGYASDFAPRRAGVAVDADIKFSVSKGGLHKVTHAELIAAGVPSDRLVGDQMRLYCRTWETAIVVSTDGLFGADDFLLFWAEPYESVYTKTNAYWLGFGAGGQRMSQRSGAPIPGGEEVVSYRHQTVYSPEKIFFNNFIPNDPTFDHWFAAFMSKTSNLNNTFSVSSRDRLSSGMAHVELSLHGGDALNDPPGHRTSVKIGTTTVGNLTYDGRCAFTGSISFQANKLGTSSTIFMLNQTRASTGNDRAYLKSLTLDYPRSLTSANGSSLSFGGATDACNYTVTGFNTSAGGFYVVDTSDPVAPVLLTDCTVSTASGSFTVTFGDSATVACAYSVVAATGVTSVDRIERVPFRNLSATSRQADYILICPYAFRTSAYRLLKHRHLDGLSVAIAPIEDVYNAFSYGIVDAGAIKQFLGYAYHHWQTPVPKYVLLAGDGTYDPKGNLGASADNVLPVRLGPSSWRWTSSDGWFAQVSGQDELVDFAIGRITVKTDAALGAVVDKIRAYETAIRGTGAWKTRATLVADKTTNGQDFKMATVDNVASHLNGFDNMAKVYLGDPFPSRRPAGRSPVAFLPDVISSRFSVMVLGATGQITISGTITMFKDCPTRRIQL